MGQDPSEASEGGGGIYSASVGPIAVKGPLQDRQAWVQSSAWPPLSCVTEGSYLSSQNLSFHICKMGIMAPTS